LKLKHTFSRREFIIIGLGAVGAAAAIYGIYHTYIKPAGEYPTYPAGMEIKLPSPKFEGEVSVEEAILRRRSVREYLDEPLTISDVAQLLWAAQGITEPTRKFRAAPSAGALYPLETYVAVGRVEGLEEGVYKYNPYKHTIIKMLDVDVRGELAKAALGQRWVERAAIDMIITAVYERTTRKYGGRGIRYVHLEAGHAAQNIYLQAVSLKLGTVVVGAFHDETVREILKLPKNESPIYIIPVGKI